MPGEQQVRQRRAKQNTGKLVEDIAVLAVNTHESGLEEFGHWFGSAYLCNKFEHCILKILQQKMRSYHMALGGRQDLREISFFLP